MIFDLFDISEEPITLRTFWSKFSIDTPKKTQPTIMVYRLARAANKRDSKTLPKTPWPKKIRIRTTQQNASLLKACLLIPCPVWTGSLAKISLIFFVCNHQDRSIQVHIFRDPSLLTFNELQASSKLSDLWGTLYWGVIKYCFSNFVQQYFFSKNKLHA